MLVTSTMFDEESPPIPVAQAFNLTDFDSSDFVGRLFAVTVTLSEAVDGMEYEGLSFDTTGTNVTVTATEQGQFGIAYTLEGSDTYSTYQSVSVLSCHG